jgi:hypothetical protein
MVSRAAWLPVRECWDILIKDRSEDGGVGIKIQSLDDSKGKIAALSLRNFVLKFLIRPYRDFINDY